MTKLEIRAQMGREALRLDQRARYPEDWHPHEYYMQRVRTVGVILYIAVLGLAGMLAFAWWVVASVPA